MQDYGVGGNPVNRGNPDSDILPYSEAVSTLYDFVGKVIQTKQAQTVNNVTTTIDKYLTYDHAGRLTTTEQQIGGDATGKVTVSENSYNEIGQLIDKKLHKTTLNNYLQSIDYTYNIRGWLTAINNPDDLSTLQPGDPNLDLFGEKLLYNTPETDLNSGYAKQFNGNIAAMVWKTTDKDKQGYAFTDDGLNRLTSGDHKSYATAWVDDDNYEEKSLTYDNNGNIKHLVRTDGLGKISADYHYQIAGNVLSSINGVGYYNYDANMNTTVDGLRGVSIAYNILNLPKLVSKGTDNIAYIYSAAGEKLAKRMKDGTYQYYAGNMVYKNDKSLNYLLFDEGLVTKTSTLYSYEYHLKDHLGNTRVTFQPNGSGTTTTQVAEYYPFGSSYLPITPAGTNKYLYNGKEKQDDVIGNTPLDWYDYGARFYDPVGRLGFTTIDPHAEKYYSVSPYAYCMNNPLKFIDPNGKDGDVDINKDKIKISVQIYIYGSVANNKQAAKMQTSIMKDWNKGFSYTDSKTGEKYKVNFDVKVQVYNKDNPKEGPGLFSNKNNPFSTSNFIEVGATSKDVGRSYVQGGDEGKWRGYGTDPSSHEFGHLIGLRDHYTDSKGTDPAWKGNVMAEPAGQGQVEQKNIDALVAPLVNKRQTKIDEDNPSW